MKRSILPIAFLIAALAIVSSSPADAAPPAPAPVAGQPIQAFGTANVTGEDTGAARTRALDDAFRQAVDQIVVSLVDPETRRKHDDVIKKRILRRSRSYVAKFKVLGEGAEENVYTVQIEATVSIETISSDLRALGVPLAAATQPDPGPEPAPDPDPAPRTAARPRILLLVTEGEGARARATFGRSTDGDTGPAADAFRRALEARGFAVLLARGLDVPTRTGGEDARELPLDDDQTASLAQQVGAGGALVAAVRSRDGGRIRGVKLAGAEADVIVRLVDLTSAGSPLKITELRGQGAGFGADLPAAEDAAGRAAAERVASDVGSRLASRWPDRGVPGLPIRIRGATRWPDVAELQKAAAAIPGVKQVIPARFVRGEIVLSVLGTASVRAVSDTLSALTIAGLSFDVRPSGGEVSVTIQSAGQPPIPATPR